MGLGTGLGMEVLSNGLLIEHPSLSVNSCVEISQLTVSEMVGKKASIFRIGALHSYVILSVLGWETRFHILPKSSTTGVLG